LSLTNKIVEHLNGQEAVFLCQA